MDNGSGDTNKKSRQMSGAHSFDTKSCKSVNQSFRSRRVRGDAQRRSQQALQQEIDPTIHVLDNGVDRTPLPLQRRGTHGGMPRGSYHGGGAVHGSINQGLPGESTSMLYSSVLNNSMDQIGLSSSMGPGSPSQMGFLTTSSSFASVSVDQHMSGSPMGSTVGAIHGAQPKGTLQSLLDEYSAVAKDGTFTREERREWLYSKTTVVLSETPTIMLYMHQDEIVSNESKEELLRVKQRNARYEALVQAKSVDEGTRFQEKGSWTFVVPKKSIHCAIHPPHKKNSGALQVTTWMLRDRFAALVVNDDVDSTLREDVEDDDDSELDESSDHEKETGGEKSEDQSSRSRGHQRSALSWMFADSLIPTLRVMERVVVQNTMEELQLFYRGITMDPAARRLPRPPEMDEKNVLEEPEAEGQDAQDSPDAAAVSLIIKSDPPSLKLPSDIKALWTFRSPLTRNRAVTCMAWNCKEADILAVGYSAICTNDTQSLDSNYLTPGGIVCCWSLKNPLAQENVIRLPVEAGVSSIAFSYEYPSLLAVGNTEGGIVIYDIQKETNVPAIKTTLKSGQHTGAVWELKWVARGKERGEFLMSISGDGRVVQWAVGKTIERVAPDLMTLKRQHGTVCESAFAAGGGSTGKQQQQWRKSDALLSRQCGGMCLDISPADGTIYVVGTEDGSVHQCNKSQTENYELDYAPHSELVYRIRWSPYSDNYFLTCSADWSARLYRLGQSKQLLTFDGPNQDAVQDVAWSYTNSSTFATVTARGSLEIWSIRDAIHPSSRAQYLDQRRLSQVLFAEQDAVVVVVGDEKGDVTVFRLTAPCYSSMNMTDDEQEQELEEAIRKAIS